MSRQEYRTLTAHTAEYYRAVSEVSIEPARIPDSHGSIKPVYIEAGCVSIEPARIPDSHLSTSLMVVKKGERFNGAGKNTGLSPSSSFITCSPYKIVSIEPARIPDSHFLRGYKGSSDFISFNGAGKNTGLSLGFYRLLIGLLIRFNGAGKNTGLSLICCVFATLTYNVSIEPARIPDSH